ncbi:MAG: hypothetical protein NVS2B3_04160 [Vulcanimicrobiaceae bacterium]
MKFTAIALVVAASLGSAVTQTPAQAAQTQQSMLAVDATFSPNPPTAKGTEKIVVRVRDASGKPVSGATVKIATSMPTMSMKGESVIARERGHGAYAADVRLNYATKWAFDITANAKGRSATAHIEAEIK